MLAEAYRRGRDYIKLEKYLQTKHT
jgi:hypothetical protein